MTSKTAQPTIDRQHIPPALSGVTGFLDLGLPVPEKVTRAITRYTTALERARALQSSTTRPLTLDDLLADDYTERVDGYLRAAAVTPDERYRVARKLVDQANAQIEPTCLAAVDEMMDTLEAWYLDHYDELAAEGDPTLHPNRAEVYTTQRRTFERTHSDLMVQANRVWDTYIWPFFAYQTWTPASYAALVESTGPALATGRNHYALARACGATPHLARSANEFRANYADATTKFPGDDPNNVDRLVAKAQAEGWTRVANL